MSQITAFHFLPFDGVVPASGSAPTVLGTMPEVIRPEDFDTTRADFDQVCDYLNKCLILVKQEPQKKRWKLKDVDDHYGWTKRFGAYVAGHPDAFALVLSRNWESFKSAAPIFASNAKIKAALSKKGFL